MRKVVHSKQAQITLIVILGLVIFLVVFFFLYNKPVKPKQTVDTNKVISELEAGIVKDHITRCIFRTASEGLEKLGFNGGYIYDFEGGTIKIGAVPPPSLASPPCTGENILSPEYQANARSLDIAYSSKSDVALGIWCDRLASPPGVKGQFIKGDGSFLGPARSIVTFSNEPCWDVKIAYDVDDDLFLAIADFKNLRPVAGSILRPDGTAVVPNFEIANPCFLGDTGQGASIRNIVYSNYSKKFYVACAQEDMWGKVVLVSVSPSGLVTPPVVVSAEPVPEWDDFRSRMVDFYGGPSSVAAGTRTVLVSWNDHAGRDVNWRLVRFDGSFVGPHIKISNAVSGNNDAQYHTAFFNPVRKEYDIFMGGLGVLKHVSVTEDGIASVVRSIPVGDMLISDAVYNRATNSYFIINEDHFTNRNLVYELRGDFSTKSPRSVSEHLDKMHYGPAVTVMNDGKTMSIMNAEGLVYFQKSTLSGSCGVVPVAAAATPVAGLIEGIDFLKYAKGQRTFNVAYGLRENHFCSLIDYSTLGYPRPNTLVSDLSALYASTDACEFNHSGASYDGFFGQSALPKVCPSFETSGCRPFAKGDVPGLTMEWQLQDYVDTKLDLCINLSSFSDQLGAEIEREGSLVTKVSMRDKDVQVLVSYPFKITFQKSAPITTVVDYQSTMPVRFLSIYNFLHNIISRDSKSLAFNSTLSATASSYFREGFSFYRIDDVCSGCDYPYKFDYLFEVADTKSILKGQPFVLRAAVQERRPVLYEIPSLIQVDLEANPSGRLVIPLNASDPDDYGVRYVFFSEGNSGWREDKVNNNGNDPIQYEDSKPFLEFFLDSSDLGKRKVSVLAYDRAGLFDYQDFVIEVTNSFFGSDVKGPECVDPCLADGKDSSFCNNWCWIANHPCNSECQGDYNPSTPGCTYCLEPILYAESVETHPVCAGQSKAACLANLPDCFWVVHDKAGVFGGECLDTSDLHSVNQPAFIEMS